MHPPYNSDSIRYALQGNPFYLQYLEYFGKGANEMFHHGRYITHVLLRMILMLPEPFLTVVFATVLLFILMVFMNTVAPKWKEDNRFIYVYAIFMMLFFLSPRVPGAFLYWWFVHAHPMSNFLTLALLFIFLKPFVNILDSSVQKINVPLFCFFAVIVGSLHEQCVSIPIFLLFYYVYLRYKKYQIPSWYWCVILCFCVGLVFTLSSAMNTPRLLRYGGGANWEFMGNKYDWMAMGIEKYFYAFVKHFILGRYTKMALPYCAVYFVLLWKLYKKNPQNIYIQKSIFYFILSWFYVGVMSASPVFRGGPEDTGMFIMYIALCMVLYQNIVEGTIPEKIMKFSSIVAGCVFCMIAVWRVLSFFNASIQHREIGKDLAYQYYELGSKDVVITAPIRRGYNTPFFNTKGRNFGFHKWYFEKYPELNSITLTNKEGIVNKLER